MMTGNANTNSEDLILPLLYLIYSVAGQVNRSQISSQQIPVVTVEYNGNDFSVVEGGEHLKKIFNESLQNLLQNQTGDFYKDLSIAIRFRQVAANSNLV